MGGGDFSPPPICLDCRHNPRFVLILQKFWDNLHFSPFILQNVH